MVLDPVALAWTLLLVIGIFAVVGVIILGIKTGQKMMISGEHEPIMEAPAEAPAAHAENAPAH